MPRQKRIWFPGAFYHVMSRGNRRTTLFKGTADYMNFLEYIKKAKELYNFKIHSICLMTNHFHISIETKDVELWKIMHRILHPYSMEFNRKYDFSGHLFESRYTSCLIEDDSYFLEVSRYIHLNPVKAQIVTKPQDYRYSSYDLFVSDHQDRKDKVKMVLSELTDTSKILGLFNNDPRERYRNFVEGSKSHAEQESLIQKDIRENDMWLPM